MHIDTILSPLELPRLTRRDLRGTACVVFDILRATSTFVTALHHGAAAIVPVNEIAKALALRKEKPEFLLAGERDGLRIRAGQSGGVDFDFGNSPREFTPERVRGKTIVSTTTNGTRALNSCAGARQVLAAAFLNLAATADFIRRENFAEVLLVCAGTGDSMAQEDVLAAGAMVDLLAAARSPVSDSSKTAQQMYGQAGANLAAAIGGSQNGRRLLGLPELSGDVAFCAQADVFNLVAAMQADGTLRRAA